MRIIFFDTLSEEENYFKVRGFSKAVFEKEPLTKERARKFKDAEAVCVFVHSMITEEVLREMPKLKYICTRSMGFDHIDLEACKRRGIKVSNVPHYGGETVAEHTFALILALLRKIPKIVARTQEENFSIAGCEGTELKGKTLGVIGPGRIGQVVIQIAKGFGMKVVAYSPNKDRKLEKKLGFEYCSLNNLLKNADIVSVHVPLCSETKHLMNKETFSLMKKGSYFINTSRGAIVDTTALLWALDSGKLAGAGLDVLEGEEDIRDERELIGKVCDGERLKVLFENHHLLRERNVIVTPHIAFYTKEAMERILSGSLANIRGFVKGKVVNRVC